MKFHGWKMISTMMVRGYTEEFQKMITRLHPTDTEDQKTHYYITGFSQGIQDEVHQFRTTTMHDAMLMVQKIELKLRKVPSTTQAKYTAPSTTIFTATTPPRGPLVCWNRKEPAHFHSNCRNPKTMLTIANNDEDPLGLEDVPETITLKPPSKSTPTTKVCLFFMIYSKGYKSLPDLSK